MIYPVGAPAMPNNTKQASAKVVPNMKRVYPLSSSHPGLEPLVGQGWRCRCTGTAASTRHETPAARRDILKLDSRNKESTALNSNYCKTKPHKISGSLVVAPPQYETFCLADFHISAAVLLLHTTRSAYTPLDLFPAILSVSRLSRV